MADSSLDDFFAKKDKSKKSKKKFSAPEQQAVNVDDAGGRKDQRGSSKKDKEKNSNISTSGGSTHTQKSEQEDDEWREVQERETDYTGLKIHNLQISELRDEEYEKEKLEERAEDGDQSWQKDGSGPWNKSSNTQTAAVSPVEMPETTEEKAEEEPVAVKAYVAPHQRAGGAASQSRASKSRNKNAPEIDDEMHFPSLSSAADGRKKGILSPDADRGFESVKRGGSRTVDESGNRGPKLDLGNKYDALSLGETS